MRQGIRSTRILVVDEGVDQMAFVSLARARSRVQPVVVLVCFGLIVARARSRIQPGSLCVWIRCVLDSE